MKTSIIFLLRFASLIHVGSSCFHDSPATERKIFYMFSINPLYGIYGFLIKEKFSSTFSCFMGLSVIFVYEEKRCYDEAFSLQFFSFHFHFKFQFEA